MLLPLQTKEFCNQQQSSSGTDSAFSLPSPPNPIFSASPSSSLFGPSPHCSVTCCYHGIIQPWAAPESATRRCHFKVQGESARWGVVSIERVPSLLLLLIKGLGQTLTSLGLHGLERPPHSSLSSEFPRKMNLPGTVIPDRITQCSVVRLVATHPL